MDIHSPLDSTTKSLKPAPTPRVPAPSDMQNATNMKRGLKGGLTMHRRRSRLLGDIVLHSRPETDQVMDETERREDCEARLYSLYDRYFADLEADVRKLAPGCRRSELETILPRQFNWQEFRAYLRGPVRNTELRRCWVERILRFGTPQDRAELREAFGAILHVSEETDDTAPSRPDPPSASSMTAPHFSSAKCLDRVRDAD